MQTAAIMMKLTLALSTLLFSFSANAGIPGTLDPSFGLGGKVLTAFSTSTDSGAAIAVLPQDQGIIVSGREFTTNSWSVFFARYWPDGSLDTSFGTDGFIRIAFPGFEPIVRGIAIQNSGNIIGVGSVTATGGTTNSFIIRLNAEGVLISKNEIDFSGSSQNDAAFAVAIQPNDDKIVVSVYATQTENKFVVARFLPTNVSNPIAIEFDTSFGNGGVSIIGFGTGRNAYPRALAIQRDGKIVLAGYEQGTGNANIALARFNQNGLVDTSFSFDGKVTTSISSTSNYATTLTFVPNLNNPQLDDIIVGGYTEIASLVYNNAIVKYSSNGNLDPNFANGAGYLNYSLNSASTQVISISAQQDGKIILVGTAKPNGVKNMYVTRLNSNGTFDTNFGTAGTTNIDYGLNTTCEANAAAMQADGRIVMTGLVYTSAGNKIDTGVARVYGDEPSSISESTTLGISNAKLFPNPVRDTATLNFDLQEKDKMTFECFDLNGRLVETFRSEIDLMPGSNSVSISAGQLPVGQYFLRLRGEKTSSTIPFIKQ